METVGGDYLCWVPTLIFYAAVQVLDARLADDNLNPNSQGDRLAYTRVYSTDSSGPGAYKNLKTLSESWRYGGKTPRVSEIAEAWRWAENLARALKESWPPT
jgi:hypothetical protein